MHCKKKKGVIRLTKIAPKEGDVPMTKYKKVMTVSSQIEAEILTSRLRAIGIDCKMENPEVQTSFRLTGHGSVLGHEIFVAEEEYEKALEIVKDYNSISVNEMEFVRKIRYIGMAVLAVILVGLYIVAMMN